MTSKQLQKISEQRQDEHRRLVSAKDKERRDAIEKFAEGLDEELSEKHDAGIKAAGIRAYEAEQAYLAEVEREAVHKAPYVPGTRLVQWERGGWLTDRKWHQTGRIGIVELVTRETVHPKGWEWSKAKVGECVVRLLKKDGLPGLHYELFGRGKYQWLPKGKEPKTGS